MNEDPAFVRKQKLLDSIAQFKSFYPEFDLLSRKEILEYLPNAQKSTDFKDSAMLKDLANYILALDVLDTFTNAQEFYVSLDTVQEIGNRTKHMSNYSDADLKAIKIPFENMIITVEGTTQPYGQFNFQCFSFSDGGFTRDGITYPTYTLKLFTETEFLADLYFTPTLLPRIFIYCEKLSQCNSGVSSTAMFGDMRVCCMKTPRTCYKCNRGDATNQTSATLADVCMQAFLTLYEVLKLFYAKPSFVYRVGKERKAITNNPSKQSEPSKVIKLTKTRYIYTSTEDIKAEHIRRNSPCEHLRKGHERHMKDGRVIPIKESTINKGKDKKIYKI